MNVLDEYSVVDIANLAFGVKTISFRPRDSKKGRLFMPVWNQEIPFIDDFRSLPFVYISKFLEKNNSSGNHYHKIKKELLIPLYGEFLIVCQQVDSRESFSLEMSANENKGVYIPTNVAHRITSKEDAGVLLVLASSPSDLSDEIELRLPDPSI